MAEQSTHIHKTLCTNWNCENTDLKKVLIQKLLESIELSATNGTSVTKGDIESNLETTPTEEPNLSPWVNITLNQLVI